MRKWLVLLLLYTLVAGAVVAGLLGGGYAQQHPGLEYAPPGGGHWLGTDALGRDVLALVLQGLWISLVVGTLAAALALAIGTGLGMLAGWSGGALDEAVVWLSSAVSAVPAILLILAIGFMLGHGLTTVVVAIGTVSWVGVFRVARAEVRRLRARDYVVAARGAGAGPWHQLRRHVLPNLMPLLVVQFALHFVYAVKTEVLLAFLGVGAVELPSWGRTIFYAVGELEHGHGWPLAAVTAALFGLVLAVQGLADRMRDRLDPRTPA